MIVFVPFTTSCFCIKPQVYSSRSLFYCAHFFHMHTAKSGCLNAEKKRFGRYIYACHRLKLPPLKLYSTSTEGRLDQLPNMSYSFLLAWLWYGKSSRLIYLEREYCYGNRTLVFLSSDFCLKVSRRLPCLPLENA